MDKRAQSQWLSANRKRADLVRYARRRAANEADAEDAAAETILRAGTAPPFRDDEHRDAWLQRVANHRCIDAFRRRPTPTVLCRAYHAEVAVTESPEETVVERDQVQRIARLVDDLPRDQRTVVLRVADEWTLDEIAVEIGRTPKATKNLLYRARHRVLTALAASELGAAAALWLRSLLRHLRSVARVGPVSALVTASVVVGVVVAGPWTSPQTAAPAPSSRTATSTVSAVAVHAVTPPLSVSRRDGELPRGVAPPLTPPSGGAAAGRRTTTTLSPPPVRKNVAGVPIEQSGHDHTRDDDGSPTVPQFVGDVEECIRHGIEVSPERVTCRNDADEG
jgi:RNA polymerase sigma factor (sigma-70 family)